MTDKEVAQKAPDAPNQVDWQLAGALMEAHYAQRAAGNSTGTSNWGAALARAAVKHFAAQPVQPADSAKPVRMCPVTDAHCESECPLPAGGTDLPTCDNPPTAQPVQPEQEPIYQYQMANGHWLDQHKESYDYNIKLGQAVVRVLYASPQAAQPVQPADHVADVSKLVNEFVIAGLAMTHLGSYAEKDYDFAMAVMKAYQQAQPVQPAPVAPVTGVINTHARTTLIQSLVASKGWMNGYAAAFVDDFADSLQPVQPADVIAKLHCDIDARPLLYPLSDYHHAMSSGPLNYTWQDKPHRLVYDLIAAVKWYAIAQPVQPAQSIPLTADAARRWNTRASATSAPKQPAAQAGERNPLTGDQIGADWTPCMKLPVIVHARKQRLGEAHVSTREGITPVKPDDLIMRGVSGEEYPIGRAIFEQTYTINTTPQPAMAQPATPQPAEGA